MKPRKMSKILGLVLSVTLLVAIAGIPEPALATNGGVILHPGDLTGSVSVPGYDITQVTIHAIDTDKLYSGSVTVNEPSGASSIDYTLTLEGDRDYYVLAEAKVVAPDGTQMIVPVHGPVNVPIGGTATQVLSVNPSFITGTISTTTDGVNTIEGFSIYAYYYPTEFDTSFYNRTYAYGLSVPGQPGRVYTLPVAPELQFDPFYAYVTVNGIQHYCPVGSITAPSAGNTLIHDFLIDANAATIFGNAHLLGAEANIYMTSVYGRAYSPYRYTSVNIIPSGAYTLNVDAGTWNVQPRFYYQLQTGDLSGKYGSLIPPTVEVPIAAGESVEQDLIIDPGYITGTVSLTGASTDIDTSSSIRAGATNSGSMQATIHEDTGEYMFVASPGDSWYYNYINLRFDYPTDPDPSLNSYIYQYYSVGDFLGPYSVTSGTTLSGIDVTLGTATVRLLYYVEGGGELSSPKYEATKEGLSYFTAYASGSSAVTTEGQAIGTLFPGTWTIEAFATVEGSVPEFGTFIVTVEEGDVVVIGGPVRPTIHITNPTEGEEIPDDSVIVEGTATDDVGIASITINGEAVAFTPTGGPDNEVEFSHEVDLPVVGENTITVVATDLDGTTPPVTLELTVTRTAVTIPTTLTYTGDTSVQVNTTATLSAILEDADGPISGAEISFQVDSQLYTVITGTDGVASCEVTLSAIGIYDVAAEFAGDATHEGSTATASLAVYTPTTLTYTGDTLVAVNSPATLAAMLKDDEGQPIPGATITFYVDSLTLSAFTDEEGVASYEVTAPSTAGVFEITAKYDGDATHEGSTATVLCAVYDPEGGFVTGGGWIDSPEGAYADDESLTGRANFGFVSKYKKGATTPTGQTEFQFQVADLNFHSDVYEWLVVAGARAQYKGTGTINSEGNYGFMLTVIDAKLTTSADVDKFRIKIWDRDTDTIVYDNQMGASDGSTPETPITGGNIVIHKE